MDIINYQSISSAFPVKAVADTGCGSPASKEIANYPNRLIEEKLSLALSNLAIAQEAAAVELDQRFAHALFLIHVQEGLGGVFT